MLKNLTILRCCALFALIVSGCQNTETTTETRIAVAEVNRKILYFDQIPQIITKDLHGSDSIAMVQNYINRWAKHELLLMRAEANLSQNAKDEIVSQLEETRANLFIYHYQRQMMQERMDTLISETVLEEYHANNENSFLLASNIVKALFIKLPASTPNISRIRTLARSNDQSAMQELEMLVYNYAERFDDFDENWISTDILLVELPARSVGNEDNFLRWNNFFEATDSLSIFMISKRDYKQRATTAPYEYVKDDIRRIIMNSRRFEFIQSLENMIYNDALRENYFKIY
jgi:hypothetical protein